MSESDARENLILSASAYGRSWDFHLQRRPIQLNDELTVQYYWMDVSDLRKGHRASSKGLQNLTNCIELWRHIVGHAQEDRNPRVIWSYLLARCYLIWAQSKGQQAIYSDAFASQASQQRFIDHPFELPLESVTRETVGGHLQSLLEGDIPTEAEQRFAEQIIFGAIQPGIQRFLHDGERGLEENLVELEAWYQSTRQRGDVRTKRSLNLLTYASKLHFYECYANAWIAIRNRLECDGLDQKSLLFLELWHGQDYEPQAGGRPPGPLGGLILALHPISGYMMRDARLRRACGELLEDLTSENYGQPEVAQWDSYRNFLGALVIAADQHQRDLEHRPRPRHAAGVEVESQSPTNDLFGSLTDFLKHAGHRCLTCSGELTAINVTNLSSSIATIQARCPCRNTDTAVNVDFNTIRAFIVAEF